MQLALFVDVAIDVEASGGGMFAFLYALNARAHCPRGQCVHSLVARMTCPARTLRQYARDLHLPCLFAHVYFGYNCVHT